MSSSLRIFIDLLLVSLVLIAFGIVDLAHSTSGIDLLSMETVQDVIFTYWLPGLVGLTLPPICLWWCLKLIPSHG